MKEEKATEKDFVALMRQRQVTPDRIVFGIAKLHSIKTGREIDNKIKPGDYLDDFRSKLFKPDPPDLPFHSGGCTLTFAPFLWIGTEGYGGVYSKLTTENPGHDAWGIIQMNFHQANGASIWQGGGYWSPTIHSGSGTPGQEWDFDFRYDNPDVVFDATVWVSFASHC